MVMRPAWGLPTLRVREFKTAGSAKMQELAAI
jgi:hypothetical protein